MFSLNTVSLIGYQTQPVNLRQTPSGTSVTDLNLIVPLTIQTEEKKVVELKSFHTVTLWGPVAEVAAQFVQPGTHLYIQGRLQTDSWDDEKTQEKRSKTKVVALSMIILDPKDGKIELPENAKSMRGTLNRADIIGHVTRDPEVRTTPSGQQVLTLGVATNDRWKDKSTGEQKERSEFHDVVLWRDLAEKTSKFVRKGNRVHVSGRVQSRSWETKDGQKRVTTEIVAEHISLLGVKNPVAEEVVQLEPVSAGSSRQTSPQAEGTPTQPESSSPQPEEFNPESVPGLSYASEIKAEDLPF